MTAPDIRERIINHLDWLEDIVDRATSGPWYVRRVGTGIRGGPGNYVFLTNSVHDKPIKAIAERQHVGTDIDMDLIAMMADPVTVRRGIQVDRETVARHRPGILIVDRHLCSPHEVVAAPYADECPEILAVALRRGLNEENK